jgi:hypothetical protein
MKLSDLVNYRNELEAMSAVPVCRHSDLEIEKITHLVEHQSIQIAEFAKSLQQKRQDIQHSL